MSQNRTLRTLTAIALLAVMPAIAAAQARLTIHRNDPGRPKRFYENIFVEGGVNFDALTASMIEFGDSSTTQAPRLHGYGVVEGCGIEFSRIRLKYVHETIRMSGDGWLAQTSNDPSGNIPVNGELGLRPSINKGVLDFTFIRRKNVDLFFGGGIGRTTITHAVRAHAMLTMQTPQGLYSAVIPVNDYGHDRIPDPTGEFGIRYRLRNGFEPTCSVSGQDSIAVGCSIAFFPGRLISRALGRR
ncbi:MAG TPA: hypothetical protein VMU07_00860 [Candidatus Paceibacterota bacterium]|nr:hypothetical protein [Candidatus Paceibacterota bacterium]